METKANINWYPGHMAKSRRDIEERLKQVDIVIEVIDARMPLSSRIKDVDVLAQNKPHLIVMTKSDLCDLNITNKWIKKYTDEGKHVVLTDLTNPTNSRKVVMNSIGMMMNHQNNKRLEKGMLKKVPRAIVIGIPNAGKSTLINVLTNRRAAHVGNTPGLTRQLSWIRLDDIELLDTPGILYPKLSSETIAYNLASFSSIKESILPIDKVAWYILKTLYKYYPDKLKERYGVEDMDADYEDVYMVIAKKRGCLRQGGNIDYDRINQIIMADMRSGMIKGVTFDRIGE